MITGILMPEQLVIMPNWIGDVVLALAVLKHKKNARCTLMVPSHLVPLCTLLADYNVIPYTRTSHAEFKASLVRIRKQHFSAIYVLPTSFSSAWFAWRTGIRCRRGIARECREIFFTEVLPRSLHSSSCHIIHEYATVTQSPLFSPESWEGFALNPDPLYAGCIVLCPGSKYGPAKRWPGYADLIGLLPDASVVLLGDRADEESAQAIAAAAPERVHNLTGQTTIAQAAAIIAGAKLVVANDSGLMHIAGYLGTPVVGIFGSTSPVWTHPLGKRSGVITAHTPCSPCFEKSCRYGHYTCLKSITPEAVAQCATEVLAL